MSISRRHHEIPQWLLREFSFDGGTTLRVGFTDSREAKPISITDAFVRRSANLRTAFEKLGDGSRQPIRSDKDERVLATFDGSASAAAKDLIAFARQHRDSGHPHIPDPDVLETAKRTIVAQARRTRESQDRMGFGDDKSEIILEAFVKRAEAIGESLRSKQELIAHPRFAELCKIVAQNHRATFAGGQNPLDLKKEAEFLAPLGIHLAVIDSPSREFIIGSHGTTIIPTGETSASWLPLAPDVALSLSARPQDIGVGICNDEFVQRHNVAARDSSDRIGGRSEQVIRGLL